MWIICNEMPFNLRFLFLKNYMWSTWSVVHSCNCDRKLTMKSHHTFISGNHFDPDMIFCLVM
jgi:hypothetical protein